MDYGVGISAVFTAYIEDEYIESNIQLTVLRQDMNGTVVTCRTDVQSTMHVALFNTSGMLDQFQPATYIVPGAYHIFTISLYSHAKYPTCTYIAWANNSCLLLTLKIYGQKLAQHTQALFSPCPLYMGSCK